MLLETQCEAALGDLSWECQGHDQGNRDSIDSAELERKYRIWDRSILCWVRLHGETFLAEVYIPVASCRVAECNLYFISCLHGMYQWCSLVSYILLNKSNPETKL